MQAGRASHRGGGHAQDKERVEECKFCFCSYTAATQSNSWLAGRQAGRQAEGGQGAGRAATAACPPLHYRRRRCRRRPGWPALSCFA